MMKLFSLIFLPIKKFNLELVWLEEKVKRGREMGGHPWLFGRREKRREWIERGISNLSENPNLYLFQYERIRERNPYRAQ